jgi:hypothetical protein
VGDIVYESDPPIRADADEGITDTGQRDVQPLRLLAEVFGVVSGPEHIFARSPVRPYGAVWLRRVGMPRHPSLKTHAPIACAPFTAALMWRMLAGAGMG